VVCPSRGEECDPPDSVTCDGNCRIIASSFCTFSQEALGTAGGNVNGPTGLVTVNPSVLPVVVGAPGDLSLTIADQASLICFLPAAGSPAILCSGLSGCGGDLLIDACASPPILDPILSGDEIVSSGGHGAGTLAGDTIAVKLSAALSDAGATPSGLRNFVLPPQLCTERGTFALDPGIADGVRTVAGLLVMADQALRDPTAFGPSDPVTRVQVDDALRAVLSAFDGCATVCR
jgi:hypothetical protein